MYLLVELKWQYQDPILTDHKNKESMYDYIEELMDDLESWDDWKFVVYTIDHALSLEYKTTLLTEEDFNLFFEIEYGVAHFKTNDHTPEMLEVYYSLEDARVIFNKHYKYQVELRRYKDYDYEVLDAK